MTQPISNSHSQEALIQPRWDLRPSVKHACLSLNMHVDMYTKPCFYTWINLTMPICLYPNASVKLLTHAVDVICQTHGTSKEDSGFTGRECGIMLIRLPQNLICII